jgi:PAS domain S-box-containing protein
VSAGSPAAREQAPATFLGANIPARDTQPFNILILEGRATDADAMVTALRRSGFKARVRRAHTREQFVAVLESISTDVVLLGGSVPGFDRSEALAHTRRTRPEIPVVIVTEALGEEAAIELLKGGAKDYVLKGRWPQLASSIDRVIAMEEGIRARKAAEQALRAANMMLETTERIAHVGGFEWDVVTGKVTWSAETYRIHGESPDTFTPSTEKFLASVYPDDRERVAAAITATIEHDQLFELEFRIRRPDGTERTLHTRGETVRDAAGKPLRLSGISRDITEFKQALDGLRASEERFRLLVEQAPEAILIYDYDANRFIDTNHNAELLFGCPREEIIKYGPQHFYATDQPDKRQIRSTFNSHNKSALRGKKTVFERKIVTKLGDQRICEVTLVRLPSAAGRLLRSSFIDVSERRRSECSLSRTNRALRTLSAGNEALFRAVSESELFKDMCRVVVESGGYRMAWIGIPQPDAEKSVLPVAWAGEDTGRLRPVLRLSWGDGPLGQGTTGRAIRSGEPEATQDVTNDPNTAPWREVATEAGVASAITLPLKNGSDVFAALMIYAGEPHAFDDEEMSLLCELADDLSYGVRALRNRIEHEELSQRWRTSLEATVVAIASTVELRDPYTSGHQQRVAKLAVEIAREMNLSDHDIHGLYLANKPGRLSPIEFQLIQGHVQAGYDILKGVDFPWPIAEMVRQHHERLDGTGYPRGLTGDQIMVQAKILAVADVVEAMMSHRPYRPALGLEAALAEIEQGKDHRYDPAVVDVCLKLSRAKRSPLLCTNS